MMSIPNIQMAPLRHFAIINHGNGHKLYQCRAPVLKRESMSLAPIVSRNRTNMKFGMNILIGNNHGAIPRSSSSSSTCNCIRNYSSSSTRKHNSNRPTIEVIRDVRYSNSHANNILDVYTYTASVAKDEDKDKDRDSAIKNDVVLYLHGGLWMKGSKDDSFRFKSNYDLASTLLRYSLYHDYDSPDSSPSNTTATNTTTSGSTNLSNFGLTFASQGIKTYVANYRLIDHNHQYLHKNKNNHNITDDNTSAEGSTEGQILDVTRAIIYVLQQHKRITQSKNEHMPNIYIVGYSAGAHLTALALTQYKYLQIAFQEYCSDHRPSKRQDSSDVLREHKELLALLDTISGFVGISGPYNLSRLDQSPLRDIIIGHLKQSMNGGVDFINEADGDSNGIEKEIKRDDINDLLMKSSPLHVILQQWKKYKETKCNTRKTHSEYFESDNNNECLIDRNIPLLAQMPVLLLNAENDFHLQTDSREFLVALSQFDSDDKDSHSIENHPKNNNKSTLGKRQHFIVQDRDHLNIAWEFGSDFCAEENFDYTIISGRDKGDKDGYENDEVIGIKSINEGYSKTSINEGSSWEFFSYYNQASSILNKGKELLSSSLYRDTTTKPDEAAAKVFHFMDDINCLRKRL